MNKRKCAVISVVVALMLLLTGIVAYWLQKNKESVSDRINRKASETDAAEKVEAGNDTVEQDSSKKTTTEEATTEDYRQICGDNILMIGSVKVELLSADVLEGDDISAETEYPVEYFQYEELPASNLLEDITDWDSVWNASAELKEMKESPYNAYTDEEYDEIWARNQEVVDKYTYTKTMPQKVYFIKCRLTNEASVAVTNTFPLEVTSVSETGELTSREDLRYFDKPIYTEGEGRSMRYFFFKLEGQESMECTIGLVVPQEFGENDHHYYGNAPEGSLGQYDPTTLPNFVDIDALPRTEK